MNNQEDIEYIDISLIRYYFRDKYLLKSLFITVGTDTWNTQVESEINGMIFES